MSSASSAASAFDDAEDDGEAHGLLPTVFGAAAAVSVAVAPTVWGRGRYYRGVHRWWRWFDGKYMKPVFGGSAPCGGPLSSAGAGASRRWKGGVEDEEGEFGLLEEEDEDALDDDLKWSRSNASEPEDGEVQELTERGPGAGLGGSKNQQQLSARPGSRGGRGGVGGVTPPLSLSQSVHPYHKVRTTSDGAGSSSSNPRASPIHHRTSGRVSPLGVMGAGGGK